MKTFLFQKLLLTSAFAALAATAQAIDSTYVGTDDGSWSKPANWSPAKVPNNTAGRTFDVSITDHSVLLNLDPTINSVAFGGDSGGLTSVNHSLLSGATSLDPATAIDFTARNTDVLLDAGELANFSAFTLTGGGYVLESSRGNSATMRFNGADIQTNDAFIWLIGEGSQIVDESNNDALSHLSHLTLDGEVDLTNHSLSTSSLVNEGSLLCDKSTWTINGDFTDIGDRRDPGTVGFLVGLGRQGKDARYVVTGTLANYDPATHTLNKGRYLLNAASGGANTLQVLGGDLLDIITNNGAVILYGPNTGMLDRDGHDALRHLAVIDRDLEVGSRSFTTAGDLLVNDSLVVFGDSNFSVSGNLTVNGFLLLSPFNAYLLNFPGYPGVPTDRSAFNTELNIQRNLVFAPESTFNVEIFGHEAGGVIKTGRHATCDGTLAVTVLDDATVTNSDTFVLLRAGYLNGRFMNAASGQRIDAQDLDGIPAGSFLVTYHRKTLVLSDYLPAEQRSTSAPSRPRHRVSSRE